MCFSHFYSDRDPYLRICMCVFARQTLGNNNFEILIPLHSKKFNICRAFMQLWPKLYLCICIYVFVDLHVHIRHLGMLILRCLYHYLFKNIAHDRPIYNFDPSCICVFVYLVIQLSSDRLELFVTPGCEMKCSTNVQPIWGSWRCLWLEWPFLGQKWGQNKGPQSGVYPAKTRHGYDLGVVIPA